MYELRTAFSAAYAYRRRLSFDCICIYIYIYIYVYIYISIYLHIYIYIYARCERRQTDAYVYIYQICLFLYIVHALVQTINRTYVPYRRTRACICIRSRVYLIANMSLYSTCIDTGNHSEVCPHR